MLIAAGLKLLCPDELTDVTNSSPNEPASCPSLMGISQETETVLNRYGAVTAERDEGGICCALGLGASADNASGNGAKPVQCALQLLTTMSQASPV